MEKFTKHYEGSDAILNCFKDIEKIADVCAIIGDNTYPQNDLVIDIPNIINSYYNLSYDGATSCFYIGFSKNACEVSQEFDDVKDEINKALFLIKLTMTYRDIPSEIMDSRDITMEVKAEI